MNLIKERIEVFMPFGRFALLNANISAIHNSPNIFLDGKKVGTLKRCLM